METKERQVLKVIRSDLKVKNFNLNYLFLVNKGEIYKLPEYRCSVSWGVNSALETREQVDAWSWLGQKVDATYPEQFGMWGSWELYLYPRFMDARQLEKWQAVDRGVAELRCISDFPSPRLVPCPLNSTALLAACKLSFNPRLCSQSK